MFARVPESLPRERRRPGGLGNTWQTIATLVRRQALLGHVLGIAAAGAAAFTYIAAAAYLFQELYAVTHSPSRA